MKTFNLEIVTPDGAMFEGQAESLLIKCESGDVEVLAGHADLFAPLAVGRARIKYDGKSRVASCAGGFLSVSKEKVMVVATTFEFADEIDVKRAKCAAENAEAAIKDAKDDAALEKAKLKLSRALNRIRVSELK
ncbi:MAG: ATP synthase F1 subunit epsilon [Clostridia bacterium]|nr:ATP synthase F1 subunit epsilon [Clostridia bacterium]